MEWEQTVNQYVQTTFNTSTLSEPLTYDLTAGLHTILGVYAPLGIGTTIINVTFGNASYSEIPLDISFKRIFFNSDEYGTIDDDLDLTIRIIE